MGKWRKFRDLSRQERRLLAEALFLLPTNAIALRLLGFRRWRSILAVLAPKLENFFKRQNSADAPPRARQSARIVKIAARNGLYRPSCLPEALTLWWLLRCQGIVNELRIGVRKAEGRLEAHAWVEHAGVVLNDTSDVHERFAAFAGALAPAGSPSDGASSKP